MKNTQSRPWSIWLSPSEINSFVNAAQQAGFKTPTTWARSVLKVEAAKLTQHRAALVHLTPKRPESETQNPEAA